MNYRQAKIVLRTIIFLIVLLGAYGVYRYYTSDSVPGQELTLQTTQTVDSIPQKVNAKVYNYTQQFNDSNDIHLVYAQQIGIKPIQETRQIMNLTCPMVEVKSCEDFHVNELSHSYPYLVEPAAKLLHDIGKEFKSRLSDQGVEYKIKVTSLLRTLESVNRLKKGNVNSTENSAHLYGTTFDISYIDFIKGEQNAKEYSEESLKKILAEVLLEMKQKGRCMVKYERKQGCFHITSTGK